MAKLKVPLILLIAAAAIAYLAAGAVSRNDVYMVAMEAFDAERAERERVRVAGFVQADSITEERERLVTRFLMRDEAGTRSVPVRYDGVLPDLFAPDAQVVVTGQLDGEGVFVADHLMTKCPSKYEGAEEPMDGYGAPETQTQPATPAAASSSDDVSSTTLTDSTRG